MPTKWKWKGLRRAGGTILLDCSEVAAGIYRLPSFIFLREGADSAVAIVLYADGGLPMQSARTEQCNHPVMLIQLTFNFDPRCAHRFGCFGVFDNREALTRQPPQDFQGFHRPSMIFVSISLYSPSLCITCFSGASFPTPSTGTERSWPCSVDLPWMLPCIAACRVSHGPGHECMNGSGKRAWYGLCQSEKRCGHFLFPGSGKPMLPEAVLVIPWSSPKGHSDSELHHWVIVHRKWLSLNISHAASN